MASLPPPPAKVPPLGADLKDTPVGRFFTDLPIRWFHATIEGVEHIPQTGGALVVGNHSVGGLDGFVLGALIIRHTGRYPRALADRNLFRVPFVRSLFKEIGALAGEPKRARELLEDGELVMVYPGGVDDSFKTSDQRNRLQWGTRAGFAKVAMRAKVPIVPIAGLGIDDMYKVVAREHLLGRAIFGSPRYDLPIALGAYGTPVPKRNPQHFVVFPPVDTNGDPESERDVERVRAATYDAIDGRLREERATGK
jgi:1-acyl-sn-glycerol-3-phosphate acyltransferase